jgi:lipopolysaccharide export system permease protein
MKKNKLGQYFLNEFLKNYLTILFAFGLIIWITQAVRLLELIGEDGNSISSYFLYIILIFPKIVSRISIIIFFISLIITVSKFEENNELKAFWLGSLKKKYFIYYLVKSSSLLLLIFIIIRLFIIPYFSNYSRHILLKSDIGFIGHLLKQNNFNNPLKKITIYIGKKNEINELEEIILFEETPQINKTIIAKSGVVLKDNNKNLIVLLNGSVQEKKANEKISIIEFEKITLDLSQYSKKSVDYYKYNEMLSHNLLKEGMKIEYGTNRLKYISELNERFALPLIIPSLTILVCFLILTNKEKINYKFLKIFVFVYGFITIILSESIVDMSSRTFYASIIAYIFPFLLILINLTILYKILKTENSFQKDDKY